MKKGNFINIPLIDAYYRKMETKTVYIDSILYIYRALKGFRKSNVIVVTKNRYIMGVLCRL